MTTSDIHSIYLYFCTLKEARFECLICNVSLSLSLKILVLLCFFFVLCFLPFMRGGGGLILPLYEGACFTHFYEGTMGVK